MNRPNSRNYHRAITTFLESVMDSLRFWEAIIYKMLELAIESKKKNLSYVKRVEGDVLKS